MRTMIEVDSKEQYKHTMEKVLWASNEHKTCNMIMLYKNRKKECSRKYAIKIDNGIIYPDIPACHTLGYTMLIIYSKQKNGGQ